MKKRIISAFLAIALILALAPQFNSAGAASTDSDYGWPEMQGDIAMRVTQNGGEVNRLVVGESYKLQFWLQNINPYAISVPIAWNPDVVTVIDPWTGAEVTSGKKSEGEPTGFIAGSKCYLSGYDPWTYEPLYWNGKPVYTSSEQSADGGYPYIDAELGHYRILYYVSSPDTPAQAQMFLEISFKVTAKGDPDFHIATVADGPGRYDPAEPDGLSAVVPGGDSGAMEVSYGYGISCPELVVLTPEEYLEEAKTPIERPEIITSADNGEPELAVTLIDAKHLDCFPYSTAAEAKAVLKNQDGEITVDSDCILPSSLISNAINTQSGKLSLLVKMPDKMIDKNEYALVFSMSNIDDMMANGMSMLYIETPWAYVGLNTGILAGQTSDSAEARLSVQPVNGGVKVAMTLNGRKIKGFSGYALRIILPYEEEGLEDTVPVAVGSDVFGDGSAADQPMSLCKVDDGHKAIIFLASSFCSYSVERSEKAEFTDLDSAVWAEEYINALSRKRVINGVGGGLFEPNSCVTREQFAVMMTRAFGMYDAVADRKGFSDVSTDDFYCGYIASAKMAGLVNGTGGGEFGYGGVITRQDLAVIAYRGLQSLGAALPTEREARAFADDGRIAPYAQEAVYALYSAGVIDGVGDGRFDPEGTATRAQAAKILSGVMEIALGVL